MEKEEEEGLVYHSEINYYVGNRPYRLEISPLTGRKDPSARHWVET